MAAGKQLEAKVAKIIYRLPPMPQTYDRLLETANDGKFDEEATQVIKDDPGLCANLLHLANSFSSSSKGTIDTIDDAISHVGIKPLAQLIKTFYVHGIFEDELGHIPHTKDYHEHSKHIALASRILAEVIGMPTDKQQMYLVAGLLHDVGRIVMAIASKDAGDLVGTPPEKMASVVTNERQALGMDHCQIGMQLFKRWNFSPTLQSCVLRHHTPILGSDFSYPGAIVFLAHFIAESDMTGQMLSRMLPDQLFKGLHITQDDFDNARQLYLDASA